MTFTVTEIPAAERKEWSKCKWQVNETGRDYPMTFVTRGQAVKYVAQREKVAAQEAAKAAKILSDRAARAATPIGAAIEPLRAATLERVGADFDGYIARMSDRIERALGDFDVLAPAPNSRMSREEYKSRNAVRASYYAVCSFNDEKRIALNDEKVAKARLDEQAAAALAYDAFIAKLIAKVGDCVAATIDGSHVWGYSHLTVTKADGSVEVWKTQQILNRSVLGTLFNQWPSRRVK